MQIIRRYLKLRPTPDIPRLFISIRNGRPVRQNIGHNTIGQMPKKIAAYLKLTCTDSYTGHSFRRTSATILASSGGNILQLKQHGGWKSSTVAEGYIEDSLSVKKSIASLVQGPSTSTSNYTRVFSSNDILHTTENTSSSAPFCSTNLDESNNFNNVVLNIPTSNLSTNNTLTTAGPAITMTCHNCTINYNFSK